MSAEIIHMGTGEKLHPTRFCQDCRHYWCAFEDGARARCRKSAQLIEIERSSVIGDNKGCGPAGNHWEPMVKRELSLINRIGGAVKNKVLGLKL